MKETSIQISIDKVLGLFRESLVQLAPKAQELKIPWKEGESYDEWDEICQVLYDNFVKNPITWAIAKEGCKILIPDYDMLYDNYSDFSYIVCSRQSESDQSSLLFHSFASQNGIFDVVRCLKVDEQGKKIDEELTCILYENLNCFFRYKRSENNYTDIYKIAI